MRFAQKAMRTFRKGYGEINRIPMKSWPRKGKALFVYANFNSCVVYLILYSITNNIKEIKQPRSKRLSDF